MMIIGQRDSRIVLRQKLGLHLYFLITDRIIDVREKPIFELIYSPSFLRRTVAIGKPIA